MNAKTPLNVTRLAVTLGDPCGTGPEITLAALDALSDVDRRRLVVVGPLAVLDEIGRRRGLRSWRWCAPDSPAPTTPGNDAVLAIDTGPVRVRPGVICAEGGGAALAAIAAAHRLITGGGAGGMVTNAIGKAAIRMAGDGHSGHTDLLADLCGGIETRMAMVHGRFRVAMTTLHVAYAQVPQLLTRDAVLTTLRLTHEAFSGPRHRQPRIAVAGLNPHAGEDGLFGREEIDVIKPAMVAFAAVNHNLHGPYPADSLFRPEIRRQYDAIVAHTHDQGLIAIKCAGGLRCVNVTLGLPYVRTSVGHGTAYDLAGTGKADHRGLLAAIRVGLQMIDARAARSSSS